jgi:hypothetical protein
MTIIGTPPRDEAEAPSVDPQDPEPAGGDEDPEPELPPAAEEDEEPVVGEESRRRWWRRRSEEQPPEQLDDTPRHVRVLPPASDDPWEQGFDTPVTAEADEIGDEDAGGDELAQEGGRRLFRRR